MKEPLLSLKKQHNIGFPTSTLHASNKNIFITDPLNIILDHLGI